MASTVTDITLHVLYNSLAVVVFSYFVRLLFTMKTVKVEVFDMSYF